MVEEITSFNNELMPLCVRFVDSNNKIREEFLLSSLLTRVTGEAIASCLLWNLTELGSWVDNRGRVSYCLYWADAWAHISWKSRSVLPLYTRCMNIISQMMWAQLHLTVKCVLRVEISQSWLILKIHHQQLTPLYWFLPQYLPRAASSTVDSTRFHFTSNWPRPSHLTNDIHTASTN